MMKRRRPSELLYDEYPLLIPPSLATLIGLNESIVVQQIHYWLGRSSHEYDGRLWVYNTYEQWHEQFPFWSVPTIRRVINGLEKSGMVISTSEYNQHASDRTKWYTLDYDKLDAVTAGEDGPPSNSAGHVINMISPSAQGEHIDVRKVSSSSLQQRLSTDLPVPPENSQDVLDPIADRNTILADRHHRPKPTYAQLQDPEQAAAWLKLQQDWDRKWSKRRV